MKHATNTSSVSGEDGPAAAVPGVTHFEVADSVGGIFRLPGSPDRFSPLLLLMTPPGWLAGRLSSAAAYIAAEEVRSRLRILPAP